MVSKRKLEIDDILRLYRFSGVDLSVKGDVAFTVSRNDLDANKVLSEIHIIRRDGTHVYLVGEGDSGPRWSPNGSLLVFTSRRGAKEEEKGTGLFIWSGFGEPRKITWFKHGVEDYKWLNDSQLVVVAPTPRKELYDEDGDYVIADRLPVWFDRKGLTAGLKYTIQLIDVESGYIKTIAEEPDWINIVEVCNNQIYYVTVMDWRNPVKQKIIRLDPKTGERETILEGYSVSALKCIDGKLYGLMHKLEIGIASHYKLWLIDEKIECLTCGVLDRNIYLIGGGYRGSIIFTYPDRGSCKLALYRDGKIEDIVSGEKYVYSASGNGELIAYVESTPIQPPELYLYKDGEHIQLTNLNTWLVREVKLYKPIREEIRVGRDRVEGWIILPEEGEKPYPLILYIHGGPKGMYGYSFHPEIQLMVSNGFAVAYANPRGSDGYEEEFADIRGRYGVDDYEQLMAFLDHVISKYPVDGGRLGVTGISYGGYMTNVIITKTNRFKAAVSENGIGDWIADYWASDIGYWFDPDQIGGTPHDNLEEYIRKSPAYNVDRVETPVLFIHSMEDYRCFIDQALSMYIPLVMRGKETKLVVFTKGSHGHSIYAKPRHRRKRYQLKLKWFKEKLRH